MSEEIEELQGAEETEPKADAMGEQPTAEPDREAMPVDDEQPPRLAFPVVGVGASAGGLEAFSEFMTAMRPDSGMAFVFILHLPPDHPSMLAEILSRRTTMPVRQVEDGLEVEPDHVYVIRPGHVLTIENGVFRLGPELGGPRAANRPVDDFFKSLAQEQRERAICIVMSGMGSNGSAGAQAIKAVGGLCVAQDPESCQYPSMPRHLIDQGYADNILRPADMPDVLLAYAAHPYATGGREADAETTLRRSQHHVREILAILRTRTRQDFSGYKKPTVLRRIQRRMGLARLIKMSDYAKLLRQSPGEVSGLADDLLIHVTGFFRDPNAWEALRQRVIVPLIAARETDAEVRAWVTACSSGEEAYTLAILLTEEADRTGKRLDIKVFATDMADRTLALARAGLFPGGIEAEITPQRLARFFEKDDGIYRVRQELREHVVFAPQNVLQDPPFSRLDIATCRNLLIYLEPEVQQRVLGLLHFGLREGGALFLGTSETVGGSDDLFEPIDKQSRIFRRVGPTRHGHIDFPLPQALRTARAARDNDNGNGGSALDERQRGKPRQSLAQRTQRTLLEQHTPAAVTVDRDRRILHYHGNTHPYFQQPAGEPSRDLMVLAREGVRGAVRAALHRAAAENTKVTVLDGWLEVKPGHRTRLAVTASPLIGGAEKEGDASDYFVVSFEQREEAPAAPPGGAAGNGNGAEMAGELCRVRDELQSTVEELQTSNEELKASHEEVVSMNEELQSSNEELETSKEEMQSLNEELTTVNSQLRAKMEEHQAASSDLASLLTSTDIAVLFLDPQFRIRRFTPPVRSLLDLIASDIGRPLNALARKFEDLRLLPDAEAVLERLVPSEREVSAEGGRWLLRRITPYRTADNRIDGVVVTFVDITARRRAEEALRAREEQFRRSIEDAPIPVLMQAEDGQVLQISRTWTELTGYALSDLPTADAWLSRAYGTGANAVREHMHELFKGELKTLDVEFAIRTRDGTDRHWSFSASAPGTLQDGRRFMVGMAIDITERQRAEEAVRINEEKYRTLFNSIDEAFCIIEVLYDAGRPVDYRFLETNPAFERHTGLKSAVGRTATGLVPGLSADWFAAYGRVLESGEPSRFQLGVDAMGRDFDVYAFAVGTPEQRRVAVLFTDITFRRRDEERQAFLLKLSDALRPLADPAAIEVEATRVLGEHLGVDRALYAEVEPDEDHILIHRDFTSAGTASITGRQKLSSFGSHWVQGYRNGRTLATSDFRDIGGSQSAAFEAIGVRACIGVPVNKGGRFVGVLIVHSATRREWTPLEIALIEATAERTWAAVERARAEGALRGAQERLRLALFAAHMGTWTWDIDADRHTRDENLSRLLGLEPVKATVPIEEFFNHIHPEDVPAVRAAFGVSARDGRPLNTEFRVVWPDGTVRWLQDQGEVFASPDAPYMTGACIDVTERRQAEAALRDSEERLRLVVEGARDFAMLLLDGTGRITAWNSGAERTLGFTESEAVGQNASIIFTPEDRAAGAPERELAQAAAAGRAVDERWHIRKREGRFWGSGVTTALRNSDGSVRGFVKVLRDETARKHAEEAERAALEAAELANRTKDEFLATLSHELRTPLSAILLWAKMLDSKSEPRALDEGLSAIRNSADAQKQLIEDLLDTSRITSGNLRLEMKPAELAAVVGSAVESVLPTAQAKGVNLIADVAPKVGTVRVDPNRIRQVLWNLLTNAIKFTPTGGNVEIRLRRLDHHVELRVTDTGKGIIADFLPHVFEPFRQADSTTTRSHGGLGLGLAISKKLVEQHGGTITAASEGLGHGSTFTVTLPLPPLQIGAARNAKAPADAPRQTNLRGVQVLLVEDDLETRQGLANVLREAGAQVTLADSATAARDAFTDSRPDLLISDIGMPGEDGYSLMRKIRTHERESGASNVPAVALTAFVNSNDKREALAAGFDQHLGKPIEPEELLTAVRTLLSP